MIGMMLFALAAEPVIDPDAYEAKRREAVAALAAWEIATEAYAECVDTRDEALEKQRKRRRWGWGLGGSLVGVGLLSLGNSAQDAGAAMLVGAVTWGLLYFPEVDGADMICAPPGVRPPDPPPALEPVAEEEIGEEEIGEEEAGGASGSGGGATRPPPARPYAVACCKHCGPTSKPCGNSCISSSKTCHVGAGCACY